MRRVATIRIILAALMLALFSSCGGQVAEEVLCETEHEQHAVIYEPLEVYDVESEVENKEIEEIEYQEAAAMPPHGYLAVLHLEFINDNLYARGPFTYREKEAAAWIMEELLAMGHSPDNVQMQEFDWFAVESQAERWFGRVWQDVLSPQLLGDATPREGRQSQNVVLTVPGQSEQKIIVGAHYDSPPYPSASDNASGVALLLESAQRMLYGDNYHTIVYVFFGAEEPGLFGAYYFFNSMSPEEQDNLVMMINADSLLEGHCLIFGTGYIPAQYWRDEMPQGARDWWPVARHWVYNLEPRSNSVTAQIDEIAAGLYAQHDIELINDPRFIISPSDHWIFAWEGHTVVNLTGLHSESDSGLQVITGFSTRIMHSVRDDFHYINETWPGKIDASMRTFSIFLEEVLLSRF